MPGRKEVGKPFAAQRGLKMGTRQDMLYRKDKDTTGSRSHFLFPLEIGAKLRKGCPVGLREETGKPGCVSWLAHGLQTGRTELPCEAAGCSPSDTTQPLSSENFPLLPHSLHETARECWKERT